MPTVAELMNALPEADETDLHVAAAPTSDVAEVSSLRPVPVGRLHRIGLLASLKTKIAAAYAFYWLRGWFKSANERERMRAETHWRTAVRVLDSMSYLRGAAMKVGQMLGSFPDIVPAEFTDTVGRLCFNAPAMHWSLLREMVYGELGDDPEEVFASFEKRAFAAASLGQVHRARLKSGEDVAVKIQYPGIARTIRQDLRNLNLFMLPARLSVDWENIREQFDDMCTRLEHETDYVREAATLTRMRTLFRADEGIVLPRGFPQYSTERVLTMEYLRGLHLDQFLATNPPQELCNDFARKILRAWYRILYAGRTLYVDCNPGNFIFMEDGRLGIIDFGSMVEMDDTLWELWRRMDRPLTTGDPEQRRAFMKEWSHLGDTPADQEQLRLMDEFCELSWRPRFCGCEFDFADEPRMRRGVDVFIEMVRKRRSRGHASSPMIMRQQFGFGALLYRLKARINAGEIADDEVRAAGWDRSAYAPNS